MAESLSLRPADEIARERRELKRKLRLHTTTQPHHTPRDGEDSERAEVQSDDRVRKSGAQQRSDITMETKKASSLSTPLAQCQLMSILRSAPSLVVERVCGVNLGVVRLRNSGGIGTGAVWVYAYDHLLTASEFQRIYWTAVLLHTSQTVS